MGSEKRKWVEATPCYSKEQQILILSLLRMRVLSEDHFKVIFAQDQQSIKAG